MKGARMAAFQNRDSDEFSRLGFSKRSCVMDRLYTPAFSLLELLITLAIVSILATITVPSFSGLVAKSRRSDAMAALVQVQLAQERWRAGNLRYSQDLQALGWSSSQSPDGYYRLRVERADAVGFRVLAQPTGVQRSDRCGIFAIGVDGPDHREGYAGSDCWRR
jgi:type IV pilus assembly protein PilE